MILFLLGHKRLLMFLLSLSLKKQRDKKSHFSFSSALSLIFFCPPYFLSFSLFLFFLSFSSKEIMGKLSLILFAFILLHHIRMVQSQLHWVGHLYPTLRTLPGGRSKSGQITRVILTLILFFFGKTQKQLFFL